MSDEPPIEITVEHAPEASPPEAKEEGAPAKPTPTKEKPAKGHVGDLSALAEATKAKFTESQAAKAAREAAAKEAPPNDEHEATELERAKADLEAATREIQALRAEVAQAHAHPLAWLSKCGMGPEALLGQLSRLDAHANLRQHVQTLEQRHAAEHAHLSGRADAAQRDLDRIASENAVIDSFEADRDKYAALSEWVDKRAARERISPHRLLIREFLEEVGRLGDAPGLRDGRITDADILDRLNDRYSDVAPPARSRRSETRRPTEHEEHEPRRAPPTLSNAQASEVATALPVDLDRLPEKEQHRILSAHARAIGVFKDA